MARSLVTKLRIPDTAAQTRKSPVARSGRAEASCRGISNTWLAHGYSSSSLTTPATQSRLSGRARLLELSCDSNHRSDLGLSELPDPEQQRSRNPHGRSTFAMIFSQLCRRARLGQGIASAFGTPVHRGWNDSVVADCRRIPSGPRGGERAGARLGARL